VTSRSKRRPSANENGSREKASHAKSLKNFPGDPGQSGAVSTNNETFLRPARNRQNSPIFTVTSNIPTCPSPSNSSGVLQLSPAAPQIFCFRSAWSWPPIGFGHLRDVHRAEFRPATSSRTLPLCRSRREDFSSCIAARAVAGSKR